MIQWNGSTAADSGAARAAARAASMKVRSSRSSMPFSGGVYVDVVTINQFSSAIVVNTTSDKYSWALSDIRTLRVRPYSSQKNSSFV